MAGRYPRNQWQSGIIASPYGPLNGARMNHFEDWLTIIVDDFDAHASGVGDVHPQYLLEPVAPVPDGPLLWDGSNFVSAKLDKDNLATNAGILKSQLAPLGIVDADVAGPISKGKLDLTGQITSSDLAPGLSLIPTGAMIDFAGAAAPSGWVLADGSTYDGTNTTYAALFALFGLTYGGTGSNFKVPDKRGRMAVMKGTHGDVDTLGKSDGVTVGTRRPTHSHLHTMTMPTHLHDVQQTPHAHLVGGVSHNNGSAGGTTTVDGNQFNAGSQIGTSGANANITVGAPLTLPTIPGVIGQSGMTDTPAYIVLNTIIKL